MTVQVTRKPPKYKDGFQLDSPIVTPGIQWFPVGTTINICKGDAVADINTGYATNAITAFANTFLGIAAADANNTTGANGAISVPVILPLPSMFFWAPNESGTVAAQTDIGEIVDLEANHSLDVTDNTCVAWGFQVVDIDISTEAIAAETGGYVFGRFITMDQA